MERCPSGLRCMIGNHVAGEYRHGGSNPPLSATKSEPVKSDGLFYFVKNGIFKDVKSCFCPHFDDTLFRCARKFDCMGFLLKYGNISFVLQAILILIPYKEAKKTFTIPSL